MKKKINKVKDFFVTLKFFAKQTCFLAKSIFMKKDPVVEYKDLAPVDDVIECDEHIKALEWAIISGKAKNIALSGPYGSGKSSIINTFLRRNPLVEKKSLKISLATFTDKNAKKLITSEELEEGILKQLFYKIEQHKIPQSRYSKIHKLSFNKIFGQMVFCSFIALIILFVFWPDTYDNGIKLIIDAGNKAYRLAGKLVPNNISINESAANFIRQYISPISLSVFSGIYLVVLASISKIVYYFAARLSIKSIKLPGDTTVESKGKDAESIFNKNMDEIIYFFEVTDFRVVFIEDLDRFRDPSIFVQLRELNVILNNCDSIKEPVVFIYAVQDDMFKEDERTKFFDFIIPVIPVINSTNSNETLLKMLRVVDGKSEKHDITREYVLDISPYISDMRVLQNIYNEFNIYKETLKIGQKLSLRDDQIMSLIVFKNLYPDQFAELQREKGIVKLAFKDKIDFIEKITIELKNQIDEKTNILNSIDQDTFNNLRELKSTMLCAVTEWQGFAYKVRINGGDIYWAETILKDEFDMQKLLKKGQWIVTYSPLRGGSTEIWPDVPHLCEPFIKRHEYLKFAGDKSKEELKTQIQALDTEIRELTILSLRKLIERYGSDNILVSIDKEKYDLLVFLLRKGYITEEYSSYINFFKANSISKDDMNFIISIKNQKPLRFTYPLMKIAETLERLQLHEFSEKAALNFDLLKYMLDSHAHYEDQLSEIFKQLSDGSPQSRDFIDQFIDNVDTQKAFVKRLAGSWDGLWDSVYDNSALTYDRQMEYLEYLLRYLDLDTLRIQNSSRHISRFFENKKDILQRLPRALADRIIDVIPALEIKFINIEIEGVHPELLNFIFDNGHYALNPSMIRSIVTFKNNSLVELLEIQNYTVVTKLGFAPLIDMIDENWELYLKQNVLIKGNTKESIQSVLAMLDRSIGNLDLCKQIIDHEEFQLEKISHACNDHISYEKENVHAIWDHLFASSKLTVSWTNVYAYWKEFSLSTRLIKYIGARYPVLSESDYECLDDKFKSDIILSEINIKAFVELLPCLVMDNFDIALEDIAPDKLNAMIHNRSFDFTIADYKELAICAPELCPTFILLNQEAFSEKMDHIELTDAVFESLIMSDQLNNSLRLSLLNRDGVRLMTVNTASYLCQLDIDLNRTLFESIWDKIDGAQKMDFFMRHISILRVQDFERYLIELGAPYDKLKRYSYRHDEFIPDTPQNRQLVDRLEYLQYLTSSEYETQTVYGPKRSEKKLPVIRCRVKVKPEEAVQAK